jgi:hypothetical protein
MANVKLHKLQERVEERDSKISMKNVKLQMLQKMRMDSKMGMSQVICAQINVRIEYQNFDQIKVRSIRNFSAAVLILFIYRRVLIFLKNMKQIFARSFFHLLSQTQ